MNILGVIAEYNPFHNGHDYHIKESIRQTGAKYVVVIMSGNFVQRGEPAIVDKWERTKMALLSGADLVVELPVAFATASAYYFAKAAVNLMFNMRIVTHISFGAESPDISKLNEIAGILNAETPQFQEELRRGLLNGTSFPIARAQAVCLQLRNSGNGSSQCFDVDDAERLLNSPNNILAIEYLRELQAINSEITPVAIKRKGAGHNDAQASNGIASASAIRSEIRKFGFERAMEFLYETMPDYAVDILKLCCAKSTFPIFFDDFSDLLILKLRQSDTADLKEIVDVTEGLENRIVKSSNEFNLISKIISATKTKRYQHTKIQRALLHILLGIRKSDFEQFIEGGGPQYIRVLGFRKESAELLTLLKDKALVPVITTMKNAEKTVSDNGLGLKMIRQEIAATDLYSIKTGNFRKGNEFLNEIVKV